MDQETLDFLKELEERIGGKPTWRSFSTWYGTNNGILREYGVFICRVGDELYLEDFDRIPTFLGIPMKGKKREKYERYSRSIKIADIVNVTRVKKAAAKEASDKFSGDIVPPASAFSKAFSSLVTQVELKSGECIYLELIDYKDFLMVITK